MRFVLASALLALGGCASSLDLCGGGAVCGADGVTYVDVCAATRADVPIRASGACEGDCALPPACPEPCDGQYLYDESTCPWTCECAPCPAATVPDGAGGCVPDGCECLPGEVCVDGGCVDPCGRCDPGDLCRGGECVDPCELCSPGEECSDGVCVDPCDECEMDEVCVSGACEDPCARCGPGDECVGGVCQPSCATIDCVEGFTCIDGACFAPCDESVFPPCGGEEHCVPLDTGDLVCLGSCADGIRNGTETDVDCGGYLCAPCDEGDLCEEPSDCETGKCDDGVCVASCTDGERNGDETDVDCGGSCPGCRASQACDGNADCLDGLCRGGVCVSTCANGMRNRGEIGIDCGGVCPRRCALGDGCEVDGDCDPSLACNRFLGRCTATYCESRCNRMELGCPGCGVGQRCEDDSVCVTGICEEETEGDGALVCMPPCDDDGELFCDGECVADDDDHCGLCGNTCAAPFRCSDGFCVVSASDP